MMINLKYVLPFGVFFAPTIAVKISEMMWSVDLSPADGFWLSLILGLIASFASVVWIFNADDPDIWFSFNDDRADE